MDGSRALQVPVLEDAIALAAAAHRGQLDKAGEPYILHVLRVMLRLSEPEARIAAVLHDLLEDTSLTLADLEALGYPERIVKAVDSLTRREGEDYLDYIRRLAPDPLARAVKFADLEDHARRIGGQPVISSKKLARYRRARRILRDFELRQAPSAAQP